MASTELPLEFGVSPPSDEERALHEILGYLNFSSGKPDPRFQRTLNQLYKSRGGWGPLAEFLKASLVRLPPNSAFANSEQASAVLALTLDELFPAYLKHHADLFFHATPETFHNPLFLARLFEAVLEQGGPWDQRPRIIEGALAQLNDFLGHRPVAVLESGQQMQPYPHERFRPLPLYIAGAGAATGPHEILIARTLAQLTKVPPDLLTDAHFHFDQLEELALDPRSYDHQHPMYKRTNYMFGEWDPHRIDNKGRYRRFLIRSIILDALANWMQSVSLPPDDILYEASSVLCGTILMASTISGAGPNTYDSTVSLSTLLSKVARQRDAYYTRLLQGLTGPLADRLKKEAEQVRQPFGKVRQHLNLFIAHHGSRQVQHSHLAYVYARMGYPEAARHEAAVIPAASTRFECEIEWRLTLAHGRVDHAEFRAARDLIIEIEDLLHRGIDCGALVDPWNILGFQGNFPLFHAREDTVADVRVETMLSLVEDLFGLYSRLLSETAAEGETAIREEATAALRGLATFWDKFATTAVSGLPTVSGEDSYQSAVQVAEALHAWRAAGEAAGDISFWRQHVHRFESPKAYALVVDALLRKRDFVAAMGLLMQWLSTADVVPLESGQYSFHALLARWLDLVLEGLRTAPESEREDRRREAWTRVVRLFDYLEANAGDYWDVPQLGAIVDKASLSRGAQDDDAVEAGAEDEDDDDEEESLFGAAYEDVVFRDSASDGNVGDTLDTGGSPAFDTDLDLVVQELESHLKFHLTLARLWESATEAFSSPAEAPAVAPIPPGAEETLAAWLRRAHAVQGDLMRLMDGVWRFEIPKPSGDQDSLHEYDRLLQLRFGLISNIVFTHVACHEAAWNLAGCQPARPEKSEAATWEKQTVDIFAAVHQRRADEVRRQLPALLTTLVKRPLLYVPLDKGGDPQKLLETRTLQAVIRALLTQLPRLGLLRETWHLLKTARRMERVAPGGGTVITEFDRLFQAAFRQSLLGIVEQWRRWKPDKSNPGEELIDLVGTVTEFYLDLWLEHSSTMRLSSLETLSDEETWREVRDFVRRYGQDFFQAPVLTLGNLRGILHHGVQPYLDYLQQSADPLRPNKLLEDLEAGTVERWWAASQLELIFRSTVEKFDRFLEYNSTTTQSDYGEQYYVFLDFLRVEASYERQAWNLTPLVIAHEVLVRAGQQQAAGIWQNVFTSRTSEAAQKHLQWLKRLEKKHGMRLPSITDLLNERFIKPLALDRIVSLVAPAMSEAQRRVEPAAFGALQKEVAEYLGTSTGSGLDVPAWLRTVETEVQTQEDAARGVADADNVHDATPWLLLTRQELRKQFDDWHKGIRSGRKKK